MKDKTYKHVYIKIPNIHKKLDKLQYMISKINIYNKIVTNFGEYKILNNDIIDITNIPFECFVEHLIIKDEILDIYINSFERNEKKIIYHIPNESNIIHIKETNYNLNNLSKIILIKEESIIINDDFYINDGNLDNKIITSYYFKITNGSENLQTIKENISAFLKYLN
jgi:hypothetical protein